MAKAKLKTEQATTAKLKTKKSTKLAKRAKARPKHKFTVSHQREADFDQGLHTYAKYRDLGIATATGGMVQAHVIRLVPPFRPEEVSTPHYHDVDFQMIYVLKGGTRPNLRAKASIPSKPAAAGYSRSALSTPCSAIPTIVNCWKL
jgi:hypothetical protein